MRRRPLLLLAALSLAACGQGRSAPAGAPTLKLGPKDGAWSGREALEGPMAVWGPPGLGREVLSVTCLPSPRRTLVVTLFKLASPSGKPAAGELTVRTGDNAVGVPLSAKDEGATEARLAVTDATVKRWEGAENLRFEVKSTPGDGADTGAPTEDLKRVLAACR